MVVTFSGLNYTVFLFQSTTNNQQLTKKGTVFPGYSWSFSPAEIPERQQNEHERIIQANLGFEGGFEKKRKRNDEVMKQEKRVEQAGKPEIRVVKTN